MWIFDEMFSTVKSSYVSVEIKRFASEVARIEGFFFVFWNSLWWKEMNWKAHGIANDNLEWIHMICELFKSFFSLNLENFITYKQLSNFNFLCYFKNKNIQICSIPNQ